MNRLEVALLHISTLFLTLTGLTYAYMHYLLKPTDPFSVINHPWEPHMLAIHILVAPLLVLVVGLIIHSHVVFKLENGSRIARRSGILLIPMFTVMVLSGYFLQVITSEFRKWLVLIHLLSGSLWFVFYASHQIASYRFRQTLPRRNGKNIVERT